MSESFMKYKDSNVEPRVGDRYEVYYDFNGEQEGVWTSETVEAGDSIEHIATLTARLVHRPFQIGDPVEVFDNGEWSEEGVINDLDLIMLEKNINES